MVSDSSLTMDDVIMISLLFLILSDTLQFEFFASRKNHGIGFCQYLHSSNYVIVSTHYALLFEIKSTLFCVNVVALSWAAWIIISIILTCYRWWYLLLVLLVLRPSISSLLQSARAIAKYDITIVSSLRTYVGPYFMSGGCKLANMEFKAYVMVYWPFWKLGIRWPVS